MPPINSVIVKMVEYYASDPRRIQHFIKVYHFAKLIGEEEGLDASAQKILETAAVVHDIGIKISEEKYGSSMGKYQELEGPPLAKELLSNLGYSKEDVERICWLVGHHHTYENICGVDYRILVEADFLVNAYEDGLSRQAIRSVCDRLFQTKTGKWLLETMFLKEQKNAGQNALKMS